MCSFTSPERCGDGDSGIPYGYKYSDDSLTAFSLRKYSPRRYEHWSFENIMGLPALHGEKHGHFQNLWAIKGIF